MVLVYIYTYRIEYTVIYIIHKHSVQYIYMYTTHKSKLQMDPLQVKIFLEHDDSRT